MIYMYTRQSDPKLSKKATRNSRMPDVKTQGRHRTVQTMPHTPHPLPSLPFLITRNDLALNSKPIILLHAFDVNVPECSHWSENSTAPSLPIWESVEVKRERETGFGNHPSGPEIARFAFGLDDCLYFRRTRGRNVCDFKETLPKVCNVVNGVTPGEEGKLLRGRSVTGLWHDAFNNPTHLQRC